MGGDSRLVRRAMPWVCLLLAASSVSAAQSWQFDLVANSVLVDGAGHVEGSLVMLRQLDMGGDEPVAGFHLRADWVRVETDRADIDVLGVVNRINGSSTNEYILADVVGTQLRADYRFMVGSLPEESPATVTHESQLCARISPSDQAQLIHSPLVDHDRKPFQTDADEALQVHGCAPSTVTVRGDFMLVLWEWDARLVADGETRELESGRQPVEAAPSWSAPVVGRAIEQYLYVHGGTLTLPNPSNDMRLYAEGLTVSAHDLRLVSADGTIVAGGEAVQPRGQTVALAGDISVHTRGVGVGKPMALDVGGDVREVRFGDTRIVAASVAPAPSSTASLRFLLLPLATAVGAGGALALRRAVAPRQQDPPRTERLVHDAKAALREGRHAHAARMFRKVLRAEPDHPEAHVRHAVCLAAMGDFEAANEAHKRALERVQQRDDPDVDYWLAQNAYHAARASMRAWRCESDLGQRESWHNSALQWLQMNFEIDDEYVEEARREPDFAPILHEITVLGTQIRNGSTFFGAAP